MLESRSEDALGSIVGGFSSLVSGWVSSRLVSGWVGEFSQQPELFKARPHSRLISADNMFLLSHPPMCFFEGNPPSQPAK